MTRVADADLYSTLGVTPSASTEEISIAFRTRAKDLHPDRHPGSPEVIEEFKALTHAYNVLIRPSSRAAYDQRRRTGAQRAHHEHGPVFKTVRSARAAAWSGVGLFVLGVAGAAVLAGLDTGDAAKTITLWIVIAKLLVCGVIFGAVGAWRLRRLRATPVRAQRVTGQ